MNKKLLQISAVLLIFFTGCKTVPGSQDKISLNGMIYDTENRPVVNYKIYIDGKGKCVSDIGGRFLISKIQKGEHIFSGNGEGYLDIEEKIVVYDKSQILYIRVPAIETKLKEAYVFIQNKEYNKAEKCIEEVLLCDEENEEALFFMTVIKHLQHDKSAAEDYLKKIQTMGGSGRYEKELEKMISK